MGGFLHRFRVCCGKKRSSLCAKCALERRAGHEMAFACMELLSTSTGCLASELLSDGSARALSPADEGPFIKWRLRLGRLNFNQA